MSGQISHVDRTADNFDSTAVFSYKYTRVIFRNKLTILFFFLTIVTGKKLTTKGIGLYILLSMSVNIFSVYKTFRSSSVVCIN